MKRIHEKDINTPEYYDELWQQSELHRWDKVRLDAFLEKVREGDSIADIGAGLFSFGHWALEKGMDVDVHALDYSQKARDITKEACPQIDYVIGDVLNTPFQDGAFDMVGAGEVIEHMQEPQKLVKEMARICKKGGWMVISTVNPSCEDAKDLEYPEHLWEFTKGDLVSLFTPYGKPEYREVGDYHFVYCRRG